jgi:hypothetical protein
MLAKYRVKQITKQKEEEEGNKTKRKKRKTKALERSWSLE